MLLDMQLGFASDFLIVNKNRPIMGLQLDEILFVQLSLAESTATSSENSKCSSVSLRQKYYDICSGTGDDTSLT